MTEQTGWPQPGQPYPPVPDPAPAPAPEPPAADPAPEPPAEPEAEAVPAPEVQEPGWLRDVADTAPVVAVALREILKLVGG